MAVEDLVSKDDNFYKFILRFLSKERFSLIEYLSIPGAFFLITKVGLFFTIAYVVLILTFSQIIKQLIMLDDMQNFHKMIMSLQKHAEKEVLESRRDPAKD